MKKLYLRSCVALLCAASLVSCGGGSGSVLVGGTVTGLTKTGLTLTNNDGPELTIVPATAGANVTFSFPQLINTDANYNVKVKQQPSAASCTPRLNTNIGKGTGNVTTVFVDCVTNSYALSGTATGLSAGSVLVNGKDQTTVAADGAFAFPAKVADGATYGITVQNCTVIGGSGRMGSEAIIANITVTCP